MAVRWPDGPMAFIIASAASHVPVATLTDPVARLQQAVHHHIEIVRLTL
jgi:hypothetical protein